jgi:hypothetical protein
MPADFVNLNDVCMLQACGGLGFDLEAGQFIGTGTARIAERFHGDHALKPTEGAAHLLAAPGHRLAVSRPAEPMFLVADPLLLEQVLTNLLANAAKFTDPGGHIRLTAEAVLPLSSSRIYLVMRSWARPAAAAWAWSPGRASSACSDWWPSR